LVGDEQRATCKNRRGPVDGKTCGWLLGLILFVSIPNPNPNPNPRLGSLRVDLYPVV